MSKRREKGEKGERKDVEVLRIDEQCTLIFDRKGNVTIGDCKGRIINPVELHLLDRVNEELENT